MGKAEGRLEKKYLCAKRVVLRDGECYTRHGVKYSMDGLTLAGQTKRSRLE